MSTKAVVCYGMKKYRKFSKYIGTDDIITIVFAIRDDMKNYIGMENYIGGIAV